MCCVHEVNVLVFQWPFNHLYITICYSTTPNSLKLFLDFSSTRGNEHVQEEVKD